MAWHGNVKLTSSKKDTRQRSSSAILLAHPNLALWYYLIAANRLGCFSPFGWTVDKRMIAFKLGKGKPFNRDDKSTPLHDFISHFLEATSISAHESWRQSYPKCLCGKKSTLKRSIHSITWIELLITEYKNLDRYSLKKLSPLSKALPPYCS